MDVRTDSATVGDPGTGVPGTPSSVLTGHPARLCNLNRFKPMHCLARVFGLGGLAIVLGSVSGVVAASETAPHLDLVKSSPAEDAVLDRAPTEIRLFFSQEPQAAGTSLRLMATDSARVATGDAEPSAEDPTVFAAPVTGAMPDGSYTVVWRAMAKDGHVVRGEFGFTVSSADGANNL